MCALRVHHGLCHMCVVLASWLLATRESDCVRVWVCSVYLTVVAVHIFGMVVLCVLFFFFFQAEDGIRYLTVTGVQTCALPIYQRRLSSPPASALPDRYADAVTTSSSAPSRAGEWDSHQRTSRISWLGSASGSDRKSVV